MTDMGFVPGLELSRGFFAEHVQPLLRRRFPELRYSAALIGSGSEVLGFDTPMSADHHWGPRVMLFLRPGDYDALREDMRAFLGHNLPSVYRGYSTNFSAPDPNDNGVQRLEPASGRFVNHRVELFTMEGFFRDYLNIEISAPLDDADWLSLPSQKLRTIVTGALFRDDLSLGSTRERLAWYPRDVWLYILGCCWARIGQEEHLMGRAGSAGDEVGSALIGSRLVRDVMRVGFLLERVYAPYPKWFGTGFRKLACASELLPHLQAALEARTWKERESGLSSAFEAILRLQLSLGIHAAVPEGVSGFWGRPFLVIHGESIAETVFSEIADERLSALARSRRIGSIDLVSDNTDILENASIRPLLRALYESPTQG